MKKEFFSSRILAFCVTKQMDEVDAKNCADGGVSFGGYIST